MCKAGAQSPEVAPLTGEPFCVASGSSLGPQLASLPQATGLPRRRKSGVGGGECGSDGCCAARS